MKIDIGQRGSGKIGSALLAALAKGAGWVSPLLTVNNAQPFQRAYGNHRPTGAALRNPADPVQAARIQAAQVKRDRKADKRAREMRVASWNNAAHQDYREDGGLTRVFPNRLHPFYINRETV